ncbi:hypothetical protein [Paracoccus sp. (in: a-proteobacteria)]
MAFVISGAGRFREVLLRTIRFAIRADKASIADPFSNAIIG